VNPGRHARWRKSHAENRMAEEISRHKKKNGQRANPEHRTEWRKSMARETFYHGKNRSAGATENRHRVRGQNREQKKSDRSLALGLKIGRENLILTGSRY
jgi:hypothetical protein